MTFHIVNEKRADGLRKSFWPIAFFLRETFYFIPLNGSYLFFDTIDPKTRRLYPMAIEHHLHESHWFDSFRPSCIYQDVHMIDESALQERPTLVDSKDAEGEQPLSPQLQSVQSSSSESHSANDIVIAFEDSKDTEGEEPLDSAESKEPESEHRPSSADSSLSTLSPEDHDRILSVFNDPRDPASVVDELNRKIFGNTTQFPSDLSVLKILQDRNAELEKRLVNLELQNEAILRILVRTYGDVD
jgi:hypothetical protein